MKILFLSRRFYPDIGGVEKHVLEVGRVLIKQGHKVLVATQSTGKVNNYQGIGIIRIPKTPKSYSEKVHVWRWFWGNRNLIKEADIVHAHDVYWWYWPFRFIFLSKKSFVTFHGYETYPIKKPAIVVRKISYYLASGNISVGKFINKWYGTKANYITYGAVNPQSIMNQRIVKNSAIFIGRLDSDTGLLEYLEAKKVVSEKKEKFKVTFIGDGELAYKIPANNRKGFARNYLSLLKSSEIVFSSSYLMILEALSLRKPVFSIYTNDLKHDYLVDAPFRDFIYISNSSNQLAEQVLSYLSNPDNQKIRKGYDWARSQTWDELVKKYYKLWQRR